MPKRSRRKADLNELARAIVDRAVGAVMTEPEEVPGDGKNPAAVALGRLGGKKGGPARAAKLTPEARQRSARKAAIARWEKAKKRSSE